MSIFSKVLPIGQLDDTNHKWSISTGKYKKEPMIVRLNETAKTWRRHPELFYRVGFAIPLTNPIPGDMPGDEEYTELNEIEDIICECIKGTGPSIHIATITNGRMRESVFYIQNAAAVPALHKTLKKRINSHDVQCYGEVDEKWKCFDDLQPR